MTKVDAWELRKNPSGYPSGPVESSIARLVAERGATMPRGDLLASTVASRRKPAQGQPSIEVLNELREDRL
jgi:hypothetical protein